MKTRIIAFPFDNEKEINAKVKLLKAMLGEDNVYTGSLKGVTLPEVAVKCNKEQWKVIRFKLDLQKSFY